MKSHLVILLLFLSVVHCDVNMNYAYCGHDRFETNKKPVYHATSVSPKAAFESIRIKVDFTHFKDSLVVKTDKITKALTKAAQTMEKLVRVKRFNVISVPADVMKANCELTSYDSSVFNNADLVVYLKTSNEIGDALMLGRPTVLYGSNKRPVAGIIKINTWVNVDYQDNAEIFLENQFLHALTHILVFSDKLYPYYPSGSNIFATENIIGKNKYLIKSPKVLAAAKQHYGCHAASGEWMMNGLELEMNPSDKAAKSSHWESRVMLGDLMIEAIYHETSLSKMTLALFEDSGWYEVNYYTGGQFKFGKNKGCTFLKQKCVDIETDKARFKNEFISKDDKNHEVCSASRQSCAYGYIKDYSYGSFQITDNEDPRIFKSINIGGWEGADYCPVAYDRPTDQRNHFDLLKNSYTKYDYQYSHCNVGINNTYGSVVYGSDTWTSPNDYKGFFTSSLSDHSFCALSKVMDRPVYSTNPVSILQYLITPPYRALCLEMFCSDTHLTVKAGDELVVCPVEGGSIKLSGEKGEIQCPDYNLICTGTTMCNYITDCIDKKSEERPNTYDYSRYKTAPKTTLDSSEADLLKPVDSFEESTNGECSQNCARCEVVPGSVTGKTYNTQCRKCGNGYTAYSPKEEDKDYTCKLTTELEVGPYYVKDGVYHDCKENCAYCKSYDTCLRCAAEYVLHCPNECVADCAKDNTCYYDDDKMCFKYCGEAIDKCHTCISPDRCESCVQDYFMLDFKYNKCYPEVDFKEKCEYYKHSPVMYRSCKLNNIEHCKCCSGPNDCSLCEDDFCILDPESETTKNYPKCWEISKMTTPAPKGIFYDKDGICLSCRSKIPNCAKCTNGDTCEECDFGYCFLNGNKKVCTQLNGRMWPTDKPAEPCYECNYKNEHCIRCKDLDTCLECEAPYVLGDGFKCILPPTTVDGCSPYYLEDLQLKACSKTLENSETCESAMRICKCKDGFAMLDNDWTKCVPDTFKNDPQYYKNPEYDGVPHGNLPARGPMYYTCSNPLFNAVENCLECPGKATCSKCKSGFVLLDDQVDECHEYEPIKEEIYPIAAPHKYGRCSKKMEHCLKCKSPDKCDVCDTHYCKLDPVKNVCSDISDGTYYLNTATDYCYKCDTSDRYCLYCKDLQNCRKCKDGYGLTPIDGKLKCKDLTILENPTYYPDGNVFYKCEVGVANCEECLSKDKCIKCKSGYSIINGDGSKCLPTASSCPDGLFFSEDGKINCWSCDKNNVDKCYKCKDRTTCEQCLDGYAFLDNDNKRCHKIEDIKENAFICRDSPLTYCSCNGKIANCDTCAKDASGNVFCTKCKYGWCTVGSTLNQCVDVSNGQYYYDTSKKTCFTCESAMEGCDICESATKCFDCKEGYLLNLNDNKCYKKEIEHCAVYGFDENKILCKKCEEPYTIIDGDQTKCELKESCPFDDCFETTYPPWRWHCNKDSPFKEHKYCKKCHNSKTCDVCEDGYLRYTKDLTCGPAPDKYCIEAFSPTTCSICKDVFDTAKNKTARMFLINGKCETCEDRGCKDCDLQGNCVVCPVEHCEVCIQDYICAYCEEGYIVTDNYGYCQSFPLASYNLFGAYGIALEIDLQLTFRLVFLTAASYTNNPFMMSSGVGYSSGGRRLETETKFECREEIRENEEIIEGVARIGTMVCKSVDFNGQSGTNYTIGKLSEFKSEDGKATIYGQENLAKKELSKDEVENLEDGKTVNTITFEAANILSCLSTNDLSFQMIGQLKYEVPSQKGVKLDIFSPKAEASCDMEVKDKIATFNCKVSAKLFTKESKTEMLILSDKPIQLKNGNVIYPVNAAETPLREVTPVCLGESSVKYVLDKDCGVTKTKVGPIIALSVILVAVAVGGVFGVLYFRKQRYGHWF